MHPEVPFSCAVVSRGLIPALAGLLVIPDARGAETIEIRPGLSYTVAELRDSAFLTKQDYLYSNGYSPGTYSEKATVARMEFAIPPAVRLGLQTMEFQVNQGNVQPDATGYAYLWYYPGISVATKKDLTLHRSGFTAKALTQDTRLTRNLLEGTNNQPTRETVMEKLGLALTIASPNQHNEWFQFTDPRLVITYQPPPADNAAGALKSLTEPSRPFEGQTDPAVVGFDADPDGDGTPNFMELWRGTNPAVADTPAPLEFAQFAPGYTGPRYPSVGAQISQEGDNYLLVRAEASHDMENWRDISSSRQPFTIDGKLNIRFTDSVPLGEKPATYFRFVAEPEKSKFSE